MAPCESSYEGLQACLDNVLAKQPHTTALVVHNEAVLPVLAAILDQRKRPVPQRISVVAICPDDMAENHSVAFTNIAIPAEEIGAMAVELAMRSLGSTALPGGRPVAVQEVGRADDATAQPAA